MKEALLKLKKYNIKVYFCPSYCYELFNEVTKKRVYCKSPQEVIAYANELSIANTANTRMAA